jgi:hypothetical protein
MKKIIVIVIVACLVASTTWLLFRKEPRAPISREEAIAKIRTYIVGVEKIPEENIRIDKIELRPKSPLRAARGESSQPSGGARPAGRMTSSLEV